MRHPCRVCLVVCALAAVPALSQAQTQLVYTALNPCRIVDTRQSAAGALVPGVVRTFNVVGSTADFPAQGGTAGGCGIPGFAGPAPQTNGVVFNFVAVNPAGAGNLRAWASDQTVPNASMLNYTSGLDIANGIIVPVRQDVEGNDLSVRADVSGAHLAVDLVGYFKPLVIVDADLPVVPISKGGTGSTVQSFVDLSSAQSVGGSKSFSASVHVNGNFTLGSPPLTAVVGQEANLRIVRGIITGATCAIQAGTGFTCTRNALGNYTVTFTPAFAAPPVPVVMPADARAVGTIIVTSSSMTFQTLNLSGAAADAIFSFILAGPR